MKFSMLLYKLNRGMIWCHVGNKILIQSFTLKPHCIIGKVHTHKHEKGQCMAGVVSISGNE